MKKIFLVSATVLVVGLFPAGSAYGVTPSPGGENGRTGSSTDMNKSFGLVNTRISSEEKALMDGESALGYDFQMTLSSGDPVSLEFYFSQSFFTFGNSPNETYTILGLGPKLNIIPPSERGWVPWVSFFLSWHIISPWTGYWYWGSVDDEDLDGSGMGYTLTLGLDHPESRLRLALRRHEAEIDLDFNILPVGKFDTTTTQLLVSFLF